MNDADLQSTVLRLPAIYGANDKHRRLRVYLKRMDDGRKFIMLGETIANWKFSRGYVDNVAHAVVLAIEQPSAAGNIFNVAEPRAMEEREFVESIGKAAGWTGEIVIVPDDQLPKHLQAAVNFNQDWEVDTAKIREQLGYAELISIDDAIAWERENPPEVEPYEIDYEAEDQALP